MTDQNAIFVLCALQKLQTNLFLINVFPKELNALILSFYKKEYIKTLNGYKLRQPGKSYQKVPYTIYRGECLTPDDHKWDSIRKNRLCECQSGQTDEIKDHDNDDSDDSGEFGNECSFVYRDGDYLVYRNYDSPNNRSHIIPYNVTEEHYQTFYHRISKYCKKMSKYKYM
jgi:hypothetical protein